MTSDPITFLIQSIIEDCTEQVRILVFPDMDEISNQQAASAIFMNFRRKSDGSYSGLRLTGVGAKLVSEKYTKYEYDLGDTKISNKVKINLAKGMSKPYYLSNHKFILFDELDSIQFALCGSDINNFSESL